MLPEQYNRLRILRKRLESEGWKESLAETLANDIVRLACCDKARPFNCVCTHSFECIEHGRIHIGTHD